MNMKPFVVLAAFAGATLAFVGCRTVPATEAERQSLEVQTHEAINDFLAVDPGMRNFVENSYAYAVYPNVATGAIGIGGAHGRGIVYEQGVPVAWTELRQGTVGLQLGGQTYRQVVFFDTRSAFERFRGGVFTLAAQASAVLATAGASAAADYEDGVAVFTMPIGGAMFQAAIGGQQLTYRPMDQARDQMQQQQRWQDHQQQHQWNQQHQQQPPIRH